MDESVGSRSWIRREWKRGSGRGSPCYELCPGRSLSGGWSRRRRRSRRCPNKLTRRETANASPWWISGGSIGPNFCRLQYVIPFLNFGRAFFHKRKLWQCWGWDERIISTVTAQLRVSTVGSSSLCSSHVSYCILITLIIYLLRTLFLFIKSTNNINYNHINFILTKQFTTGKANQESEFIYVIKLGLISLWIL